MRSTVVLMTGFTLLVAGVLVLALTGATALGVALVVLGVVVKVAAVLLGEPSTRPAGPAASRPRTRANPGGAARARSGGGVVIRARRPVRPATSAPSAHGRRRAS